MTGANGHASGRILLVEDDRDLLEFLRHLFVQEKYHVLTAQDGEEALKKASQERPDIILLDALLPKIHGFEVCQRLRQEPTTCLIPIIMVTSLTALKDRLTGFKLGADEYVAKPFEPVELLARVERLLERTRQNMQTNPLTGLPGTGMFEQEIQRRLDERSRFCLGLGDANGMDIYNRAYGIEKRDEVVRLLAVILKSAVVELGNYNDFAAHLGAATFGIVSTPSRTEVIGARILENVEALIPVHYDKASREGNVHLFKDESGRVKKLPFLSFSIGVVEVSPETTNYRDMAQVFAQAQSALSEARKKSGNHLVRLA